MTRVQEAFLLFLVLVLGLLLRGANLERPNELVYDEPYFLPYEGERPAWELHAPPWGKAQIRLGYRVGQSLDSAARWRYASVLAGMGTLLVVYFWARSLAGPWAGFLSALLLCGDGLHLVQSRIGTLDIFLVFWSSLGFLLTTLFREKQGRLWTAGVCFGLAASCKWNGFFHLLAAMLALRLTSTLPLKVAAQMAGAAVLTFVLTFTPFLFENGLWESLSILSLGAQDLLHLRSSREHWNHPYFSRPWTWPLVFRPIWYYFQDNGETVRGIVALGTLPFWWTSLLFLSEKLYRKEYLLPCLYLVPWLAWFVHPTAGLYHYMLPAVPVMAVCCGLALSQWWARRRWLVLAYLGVCFAWLYLYLPFLTAEPVSRDVFKQLFRFSAWI